LAHLARELVVSPWLVGVGCDISALLGGVESSYERDITKVLVSPRGINAPRLVPIGLKMAAPLGGSIHRNISSPDNGLLLW
jgi:hypothetical protein